MTSRTDKRQTTSRVDEKTWRDVAHLTPAPPTSNSSRRVCVIYVLFRISKAQFVINGSMAFSTAWPVFALLFKLRSSTTSLLNASQLGFYGSQPPRLPQTPRSLPPSCPKRLRQRPLCLLRGIKAIINPLHCQQNNVLLCFLTWGQSSLPQFSHEDCNVSLTRSSSTFPDSFLEPVCT